VSERKKTPANGWQPGQSGNPKGKPHGARNKATQMVMALMEDGAKEVAKAVVDAAKAGDLSEARLVLERLAPPMRERPITITLPDTQSTEGISAAQQTILEAVGAGELLPSEGVTLAGIVEARRKAMETQELEARISALEAKK